MLYRPNDEPQAGSQSDSHCPAHSESVADVQRPQRSASTHSLASTPSSASSDSTPDPAEYACTVTNLSVAYGDQLVLKGANVAVPTEVVMGIVGPNGAGKSTLIKAMLGLTPTLTGKVEFFGQSLKVSRGRVGYMPQRSTIDWDFPTTVKDAVLMGTYGRLGWFRRPGALEHIAAETALEQVDMLDYAARQIGQLSGGQRQRVLLARTLATQPDVLLLDEPFQGVDAISLQAIVEVLHDLRSEGKTVVLVHHDLATVDQYCDHVTLINRSVIASGTVAESFTPETVRATYGIGESTHPFLQDLS